MLTLLAGLPLVIAVVALGILQRTGRTAGLATLAAAAALALVVPAFRLAPWQLVVAAGQGAALSLIVLGVLLPGLLLFQVQAAAGSLGVLARGVTRLAPDRNRQTLLLFLGVAPFVESLSGFGVGTLVVVPLFLALGFGRRQAALLGVLSQVAIPWGALAIGTTLGAQLTGIAESTLGARTAVLTAPLPAAYALVALMVAGGRPALQHGWQPAIGAGLSLAAAAWLFSTTVGIALAGALASATALLLLSWPLPRRRTANLQVNSIVEAAPRDAMHRLLGAAAPYALLLGGLTLSRPIILAYEAATDGGRLPLIEHPGIWVFAAALGSARLLGHNRSSIITAARDAWRQFVPGALAIMAFLAAAQVMSVSGMTATMAGAAALSGSYYHWLAPWLGALGGWLTGSNAGSNAVLARLQAEAASVAGLPVEWIMAGQNSAASHATIASPARTILAATAAGLADGEAYLVRRAGVVVLAAVGIITVALGLVLA